MSADSTLQNVWGPRWLNAAAWTRTADIMVALTAAVLPWSTSLTAIFISLFIVAMLPTIDWKAFVVLLKRPICYVPMLLVVLAMLGMLWASDVPWPARLRGANPTLKLLVIPFLIYHYERSGLGIWPAAAFVASCVLLMLTSWLMFIGLDVALKSPAVMGVPVKNSIVQSQEFVLCAFGLAGLAMHLLRSQRQWLAAATVCLIALFMINTIFVSLSRTSLVCMAALLLVFAMRFFSYKGVIVILLCAAAAGAAAWTSSSYLKQRVGDVLIEYERYKTSNIVTSTGQRLEYWRKSVKFFLAAPIQGHGSGATKTLFEKDAVGQTGVSADVSSNPHNQTLMVAIQWGVLGVILLYATWIAHVLLFTGPSMTAYIGLIGVAENIVGSVFNSHLFDFTEGWMYVLVVGIAGGMVFRSREGAPRNA